MKTLSALSSGLLSLGLALIATSATAQEAGVKIDKIPTNEDTSITIRKGANRDCDAKPNYDVVSGTEELASDEEFDDKKALAGWKQACADWKKELKEMNAGNQILVASCGTKSKTKEGGKTIFKSTASYKLKVRIKD